MEIFSRHVATLLYSYKSYNLRNIEITSMNRDKVFSVALIVPTGGQEEVMVTEQKLVLP